MFTAPQEGIPYAEAVVSVASALETPQLDCLEQLAIAESAAATLSSDASAAAIA